jgi:hypothetical protein
MISPENDIFFTTKKDLKEELKNIASYWPNTTNKCLSSETQTEEGILSTIKKACDAIKEREVLIKLFKEDLKKTKDKIQIKEIKLAIAGSKAEIKNIEDFLDDIIKRFKASILEKSTFTLSDCADIEKRLDKAEIHLWEFGQGTTSLKEINEIFGEEELSLKK